MATDFIMPRMPDPSQAHYYHTQQQQLPAQYQAPVYPTNSSANISPLSTSNSSPTSPKSTYHARRLQPLYMPAVLRPTEHPSRAPPKPKQPKADNESLDERTPRSSGSFISLPGLGSLNIGRLSRRSTGDSGKVIEDDWNWDLFPEVKGLPSRQHWKVRWQRVKPNRCLRLVTVVIHCAHLMHVSPTPPSSG